MPFWRLYYHLIWLTQHREPLITEAVEARLFPYLVSKAAENGVFVYAINAWYDHVHLVVAIPPKHSVSEIVKRLKGASAHYMNYDVRLDRPFAWQRGYGALSVGERQRAIAERYVARQKLHHARRTTNLWLERADELDEGPPDRPTADDGTTGSLRETHAQYCVDNELLF